MGLFSSLVSGITGAATSNPVGLGKGIVGIATGAANFVGNIAQQQGKNTFTLQGVAGAVTLPTPKSVNNFLDKLQQVNPNSSILQSFSNYMTPAQQNSFLQGGFQANVSGGAGTPGSPMAQTTALQGQLGSLLSMIFGLILSPIGILFLIYWFFIRDDGKKKK